MTIKTVTFPFEYTIYYYSNREDIACKFYSFECILVGFGRSENNQINLASDKGIKGTARTLNPISVPSNILALSISK